MVGDAGVKESRQAKVSNFQNTIIVNQKIGTFYVPLENPMPLKIIEAPGIAAYSI